MAIDPAGAGPDGRNDDGATSVDTDVDDGSAGWAADGVGEALGVGDALGRHDQHDGVVGDGHLLPVVVDTGGEAGEGGGARLADVHAGVGHGPDGAPGPVVVDGDEGVEAGDDRRQGQHRGEPAV